MQPPQHSDYVNHDRAELLQFLPAGVTSVLDVGCARGGWGNLLRDHLGPDARIVGIEAVETQAAVADQGGLDVVYRGYFPDDLPEDEAGFDLITFNDVLEHIVDPWSVLRSTHARLTPGGFVLASIPSIQFAPVVLKLIRGRWDYAEDGTLDRTHLRFFTRATMAEMFEHCGYVVVNQHGINSIGSSRELSAGPTKRTALKLGRRALGDAQFSQFVVLARSMGASS